MAAFDRIHSQIVTRIVYDGAVMAGKTTNLVALTELFTRARRSELYTPEAAQQRTLFFDYIQLEGGLIAGHHYRCELWAIPGQEVLRPRREFILKLADVLVLVVDSRPQGIDAARYLLRSHRSDKGLRLPLIVQANKQDFPDALPPEQVRHALELPESVPVVRAEAEKGQGVRETTLLAMRRAAEALHDQVSHHGPEVLGDFVDPPELIHKRMKRIQLHSLSAGLDPKTPLTESLPPSSSFPPAAKMPVPPAPTLPDPSSPSTQIWAPTGKVAAIRALPWATAYAESADGLPPETHRYAVGDYWLHTSDGSFFSDSAAAKHAFRARINWHAELGPLAPPEMFVLLQPGPSGYWLWTLRPALPALDADIQAAEAVFSHSSLSHTLALYARATVLLLQQLRECALSMRLSADQFIQHQDGVFYVGEPHGPVTKAEHIGEQWLAPVDYYAEMAPDVVEHYVSELEKALVELAPEENRTAWAVLDSVASIAPATEAGLDAQQRLTTALQHLNHAAASLPP